MMLTREGKGNWFRRAWILAAALMLLCVSARAEGTAALIREVLEEQRTLAGRESLQAWTDQELTENADGSGGWILIALRRLGRMEKDAEQAAEDAFPGTSELDFCAPRAALEARAEEETGSVTKRERMALTLQALGSGSPFIRETAEAGARENTLMPLVFALHLMNNDPEDFRQLRADTAERLIALQLEDGGWAVIGDSCDADCTAMTIQALTPLLDSPEISESVERGLRALSGIQLENGGFSGMGLESAESCAQVLLALSGLGMDAETEESFLKDGNSVLDAMLRFRVPGEGFAHDLQSGRRNETATVQCFYALVGYESMRRGGGAYYVFDFDPPADHRAETAGTTEGAEPAELPRVPGDGMEGRAEAVSAPENAAAAAGGISVKAWLWLGTGLLVALAWGLAVRRKKRNWRSYAFPLLAGGLLAAAIFAIDIQSPESYYQGQGRPAGDRNLRTEISIRCDTVAGENAYAPADGVILKEETVLMAEGETAFDQLLEATRAARIQMEYDGTAAGAYVRGIAYLYEYDFGNLSGWMYRVNGVFADVGCSQYRLQEGDRVEWVYTRNLGRDGDLP